jgi:uncharacterized protein (TIGR02145 family)
MKRKMLLMMMCAPGIITPLTYTLTASATGFCEGTTDGVSFALQGTQKGVKYQLYRDAALAGTLTGTGSAATFSDTFITAGTYTVRTVAEGAYQTTLMNGSHTITSNPLPTEPVIAKPADVSQGGTLVFTATGYSGALTWTSVTAGGSVSGSSVIFTNVTTGTKSVTAQSAQTYTNAPTCYSATVTQSSTVVTGGCTSPGETVNFTAFNPCVTAPSGSTWSLADTREASLSPNNPQTYTVKLMVDGRYWMVQDLKFGNKCNKTTFAGSSKNQTGNVTTLTDKTYYGDCRSTTYTGSGYFYDWAATMNKSNAFAGTTVTVGCSGSVTGSTANNCQGICPSGWHVSTVNEAQHIYYLLGNANNAETIANFGNIVITIDTNPKHWHAVYSGYVTQSGGNNAVGGEGWYWTSTDPSPGGPSCISPYKASVSVGATRASSFGFRARCVKNY